MPLIPGFSTASSDRSSQPAKYRFYEAAKAACSEEDRVASRWNWAHLDFEEEPGMIWRWWIWKWVKSAPCAGAVQVKGETDLCRRSAECPSLCLSTAHHRLRGRTMCDSGRLPGRCPSQSRLCTSGGCLLSRYMLTARNSSVIDGSRWRLITPWEGSLAPGGSL